MTDKEIISEMLKRANIKTYENANSIEIEDKDIDIYFHEDGSLDHVYNNRYVPRSW